MNIHIWIPELFASKGGIQVYSYFFLQALQKLYPHSQFSVFVKHDKKIPENQPYLSNTRFNFSGAYPSKIRTPCFAAKLIGKALLSRPDLVISTHLNFAQAAYWLNRVIGTPYWVVAHGIDAWDIQSFSLIKALHNAEQILCVSNFTRDVLIKQQNCNPDKLSILFNTFDYNRFQKGSKPEHLLRRYNLKAEQKIILTVARLSKAEGYKGYDSILNALPQIRKYIPDVHYVLVGKGDDRPRIEEIISRLDLKDCVTLTGYIPDEELNDYYNLCDVFAMPSKKEGFGIVYLEALSCGKPVLAGNQDGAQDALCQGELGVLVNPDDIEAIATKLINILQRTYPNPLLYQPQTLREKAIEQFGFESFQSRLDMLLKHKFADSKLIVKSSKPDFNWVNDKN
ncbi:glycosyltransferase family 4 protein [Calothrix sp. NIES-3974]|uniref:glycosyltransferase family 4 protein n=1 Tax=Calothrix sp. NIES-3974 TaxID=2005462 RepID=UPI000B616967|nr:glycosyltransferase family 4 protein [Calothrix sp. NIES-3974]BAZ03607.1 glycosyltransferase [Calothrix sp. NIES-3974]